MSKWSSKFKAYWDSFPERQAARDRLVWWAKYFSLVILIFFLVVTVLGWTIASTRLCLLFHPAFNLSGPLTLPAGLMLFPGLLVAVVLSPLLANIICWLVPPVRRAHDRAFHGIRHGEFASANADLLSAAVIVLPISAALAALGIWLA